MKRLLTTGAVVAALAFSLVACSDDDSSPKDEATKAAGETCTNLAALKSDTAALKNLDAASATKDQLKEANQKVQDDWDKVKDSLGDLTSAKRDAVKGAADDLKSAYEDVPGDATGKDALTELKPQIDKLAETTAAASTELKCP
ncbi:hypothetical protein G6045_00665 [Streptomyces sp. YC504]|uniref:Uncharacterized protein n=1 Tax=Streptomyces mesophilus TaxID=1775132 RepID=A0A6G4X9I8_9ACTN|nr:hypothetical protein [Streptomyces mesophilus]NGO74206.1 hypothetical protein [Streptomyces mesophilus]